MAPVPRKPARSKGVKATAAKSSRSVPSGSKGKAKRRDATHHASGQPKPKSDMNGGRKVKKRTYSEEELGIPRLNMITPAGVHKPQGKKKGKVFVDDQKSMLTILAMVNADREGQIESKMMRARQMEEIREAKKREAEARLEEKRSKLEETKESIRQHKKRKPGAGPSESKLPESAKSVVKKRVSFT